MNLFTILLGAALLYALWVGVLSIMAPRLIYPFAQEPFEDTGYDMLDVIADDGLHLPVAIAQGRPEQPVVLFFMGNYGARAGFTGLLDPLRAEEYGIVAMPYRGGEGLGGRPSEPMLKADALRVFDDIADHPYFRGRPIHLFGYSLGSGLAMHVASERMADSVVLLAPFDRLCAVAAARVKVPACALPWIPAWDNAGLADQVAEPILLMHGLNDTLIPPRFGEALAEALSMADARLAVRVFPGAGHNDIGVDPRMMEILKVWLNGGWRDVRTTPDVESIRATFGPMPPV